MNLRAFEILSILNPSFKMQDWCQSPVLKLNEVPYKEFYKSTQEELVTLLPNIITGTNHYSYNKGSWINMLEGLKERGSTWKDVTKERVLKEIDEHNLKKDYISIWQYSDNYIIMSGNHRCCYAKFLELDSIEVKLTKHILKGEEFNIYKQLEFHNFQPKEYNTFNNWFAEISIGKSKINLESLNLVQYFLHFYNNLPIKYGLMNMVRIKLFNENIENKYEKYLWLKSNKEVEKLRLLLINHKIKQTSNEY